MPQLSQIGEIYASQLFWLAVVFALIYFGIGRAMVPRIERTIDDRDARIKGDLDAAEAARAAASTLDHDYHAGLDAARSTALRDVTEAKVKATAAAETRVKAGDAKLASAVADAANRIGASRAAAMAEIEAATVEAVQDIVTKLSGVKVDRTTAAAKVKAELAHG
ncbi:ATPase [Sphingomonas sp. AR_OL41]|uniref:F0F1 ATP synthase subunit B family protein n=1 Tax=Sphingomonas sp. AR_OL41 TaxID=3042729 RepID=UPI002480EC4E|nr:ATPase [Sphingomonas sp. AR_OL41]MDH7973081.1 ATPase [Sphingomonas sp. AR_OL41]